MKKMDFSIIGLRMRERRTYLGITQERIANELDINPSHISNIECGRTNPSLTSLIYIADILECSVDYLLGRDNINKKKEKTLDDKIIDKLKYYDANKKSRLLKIMSLL